MGKELSDFLLTIGLVGVGSLVALEGLQLIVKRIMDIYCEKYYEKKGICPMEMVGRKNNIDNYNNKI